MISQCYHIIENGWLRSREVCWKTDCLYSTTSLFLTSSCSFCSHFFHSWICSSSNPPASHTSFYCQSCWLQDQQWKTKLQMEAFVGTLFIIVILFAMTSKNSCSSYVPFVVLTIVWGHFNLQCHIFGSEILRSWSCYKSPKQWELMYHLWFF